MQPTASKPHVDFLFTEAQRAQLMPSHKSMLLPRQRGDWRVVPASPREPVYRTG